MAVSEDGSWALIGVTDSGKGAIYRIGPATNNEPLLITTAGDPRAIVALDYSFPQLWFLRAEAQTGSDQVVRSIEFGGGVYKMASPTVRIYGVALLGHDWERQRFDLSAGAGAAWQPFGDGVLQKVSAYAESRVVINLTHPTKQSPEWLNAVGLRYSF